ncbi:MAG: 54S ribosomal protein L2 mitochondrial [Alectoria sarmentosa]|nr:MAG: 54S ribosomal protein L2 mitochondrial [Alectoria sarmentosa]
MPPLCLRSPRLSLPSQICPSFQWLPLLPLHHSRPASHASQGRANKAAPGPGKRLGAKKGASELVVPGNIIFRQRGTHWFPGENCDMGRDHTIFAKEKGYVCFYKDPETHRKRKYIGVVFERGMKLPVPRNKPRNRRLGLVGREREIGTLATSIPPRVTSGEGDEGLEVGGMIEQGDTLRRQDKRTGKKVLELKKMELKQGYQYRESNTHIGRAAERAQVKVREFQRGDRFLAWRKLKARKARTAAKRALSSRKKKGSKKKGLKK